MRILRLAAILQLAVTVWAIPGCSNGITGPAGDFMLEEFGFARSEIAVGEPLIVVGRAIPAPDTFEPQPFLLHLGSGETLPYSFNPPAPGRRSVWASVSDEELAAVIASRENQVWIGFKEADAARGTDEYGQNITSVETVEGMKEWIQEQGVTITFESEFIPAVMGTLQPEVERVTTIRWHENVDYFEPPSQGYPEGDADPIVVMQAGDFVAVVLTSDDGTSGVRTQPGDQLTVVYEQPDGSRLSATATVR